MLGVIGHRGGVATHDACQGLYLHIVGNHTYFFVEGDRVAVKQLELLAWFAPAHVQAAVDLV